MSLVDNDKNENDHGLNETNFHYNDDDDHSLIIVIDEIKTATKFDLLTMTTTNIRAQSEIFIVNLHTGSF